MFKIRHITQREFKMADIKIIMVSKVLSLLTPLQQRPITKNYDTKVANFISLSKMYNITAFLSLHKGLSIKMWLPDIIKTALNPENTKNQPMS